MIDATNAAAAMQRYAKQDAKADLAAGLAVAAVAIPVGVAYAELAGFRPEVGLYSSILPLVAYAVFGSSRQLIVGPDAATCALVAAAVTPLAGGDAALYSSLSVTLALMTGVICIAASFLRLGVLADFLSRPILVGFLNGVALSIMLGQMGKLLGFRVAAKGIIPPIIEVLGRLGEIQAPTFAVAAGSFAALVIVPRLAPWLPASIVAMGAAGAAVAAFSLERHGVKTLGVVPNGLPALQAPHFDPNLMPELLAQAAGLALVSFSSLMLTSRSFASKNGYDVDPDRDFAALGAANLASALSQGFTISGADSRTAVADAAGGRTRITGLVAAAAVALVVMFFTAPLRYVPEAAMAAVLVMAGLSLVDLQTLRLLYRIDPVEAGMSVLATIGVVAVGPVNAILFVVILALLRFVQLVARPRVEILGQIKGMSGWHSLARHAEGETHPALLLLRFNGPLVFFNAAFFKQTIMTSVREADPELRNVVIDLLPVTAIDATGLFTVNEVAEALRAKGIGVCAAGRATEWRQWSEKRNFQIRNVRMFPSLRAAFSELGAEAEMESTNSTESGDNVRSHQE